MKSGKIFHSSWLLILVLVVFGLAKPTLADSATWTPTGSLTVGRMDHTATLLSNGQVLVVGGDGSTSGDFASAELYNPVTGSWTSTGSLFWGRDSHTATLLSNGQVLVVGGYPAGYTPELGYPNQYTAELYDPTTGTWAFTTTIGVWPTIATTLTQGRYDHTATRLANGKVLVVGGYAGITGNGLLASAELYDPTTGLWSSAGALTQARDGHTATLLANGQVLVVGGRIDDPGHITSGSELYDPNTGIWTPTGALNQARYSHTTTLLTNGKVLVAGGYQSDFPNILSTAELYDPATGLWTSTGSFTWIRALHTASLLPNGQVLIAGGYRPCSTLYCSIYPSAELYDPTTGTWAETGTLTDRRYLHTATVLSNGQVLVVGGKDDIRVLSSAELYGSPQILNQTITITTNAPASAQAGDEFTVSATASSGLPVSYSSSGACTNVGATFTMVSGVGACTVYYDQPGDSTYNPAPQVTETVNDANDPPTALNLSSASVAGNMPVGTAVGTFSSVDADSGDTFTYALVSGLGSEDNSSFNIVGDQLQTAAVFDSTIKNSYSVRVRTTDRGSGNLFFEQAFTITVTANNYTSSLLVPANLEQLLNNRPTFDWTDIPGASSYRIQINRSISFANGTKVVNTTNSSSSYTPSSDLPAGIILYWRVQANMAFGAGPWSEIRSFATANPPSVPVLVSPKTNSKNISLTPTLDWNNSTIPVGTAFLQYELQLSTDSAFASPAIAYITGSTTSSFYTVSTNLNPGTKYYWRVRVFNTFGQYSLWSSVRTFTTQP